MTIIQVPDEIAAHVGIAVARYCRQLRRDGHVPPPELAQLAGRLVGDDPVTRRRKLGAARTRRYRQRQREARAS